MDAVLAGVRTPHLITAHGVTRSTGSEQRQPGRNLLLWALALGSRLIAFSKPPHEQMRHRPGPTPFTECRQRAPRSLLWGPRIFHSECGSSLLLPAALAPDGRISLAFEARKLRIQRRVFLSGCGSPAEGCSARSEYLMLTAARFVQPLGQVFQATCCSCPPPPPPPHGSPRPSRL